MTLTDEQAELLCDAMRSYGFDTSELDAGDLDKIAASVLQAMKIEFEN